VSPSKITAIKRKNRAAEQARRYICQRREKENKTCSKKKK
jgi:hypothetical protein